MTEIRTKIADALVKVTNRWIAPNFPADHKLREFSELDDREQRLNLDYADAALGVIGDAPAAGDPVEKWAKSKAESVYPDPFASVYSEEECQENCTAASQREAFVEGANWARGLLTQSAATSDTPPIAQLLRDYPDFRMVPTRVLQAAYDLLISGMQVGDDDKKAVISARRELLNLINERPAAARNQGQGGGPHS